MLMSVHSIQSVYFEVSRSYFCEDGLSIMFTLQYLYALQGLSHPLGFPVPWMFGPYDLSGPLDCPACGSRRGPCMPPVVGRSIFCLVLQHSDFLVRIPRVKLNLIDLMSCFRSFPTILRCRFCHVTFITE